MNMGLFRLPRLLTSLSAFLAFTIALAVALSLNPTSLQAQDVTCTPESVIATFATATDMAAWAEQYSTCSSRIQRAVVLMADAYAVLGSEYTPFASADDSNTLNAIWSWYQGGTAVAGSYGVNAALNTLTLYATQQTQQRDDANTASVMAYMAQGDLVAQVSLNFSPINPESGAGIGLRDLQDPNRWIRIARIGDRLEATANDASAATVLGGVNYAGGNTIYLRVERTGTQITLSSSVNGRAWSPLVSEYDFATLSSEVELFLTSFNPQETGVGLAIFSELQIEEDDLLKNGLP